MLALHKFKIYAIFNSTRFNIFIKFKNVNRIVLISNQYNFKIIIVPISFKSVIVIIIFYYRLGQYPHKIKYAKSNQDGYLHELDGSAGGVPRTMTETGVTASALANCIRVKVQLLWFEWLAADVAH